MSIYKGNTKLAGTGQVVANIDDTLNSTSNRAVTNAAIADVLEDMGHSSWQKPSDWPDIRSGAFQNSVYFLVGHSADYSTYPKFSVYAEIQNSGTYDVYVDGIKQATTASGTETVLTWQTLALTSGWDVTYPSALHTHIVRVTPTSQANKITNMRLNRNPGWDELKHGVLWAHFSIDYALSLAACMGTAYVGITPILEVVTAFNDTLRATNSNNFLRQSKIKYFTPVLDCSSLTGSMASMFMDCSKLVGKVVIKNLSTTLSVSSYSRIFQNATSLEKIVFDGSCVQNLFYVFDRCKALKEIKGMLPSNSNLDNIYWTENLAYEKPMYLYFSQVTNASKIDLQKNPMLKGLTVSDQAPFGGASPQINVSNTGLDRAALVNLFNSLSTVSASQVCDITGATGASSLTAEDLAIATNKGWTITR